MRRGTGGGWRWRRSRGTRRCRGARRRTLSGVRCGRRACAAAAHELPRSPPLTHAHLLQDLALGGVEAVGGDQAGLHEQAVCAQTRGAGCATVQWRLFRKLWARRVPELAAEREGERRVRGKQARVPWPERWQEGNPCCCVLCTNCSTHLLGCRPRGTLWPAAARRWAAHQTLSPPHRRCRQAGARGRRQRAGGQASVRAPLKCNCNATCSWNNYFDKAGNSPHRAQQLGLPATAHTPVGALHHQRDSLAVHVVIQHCSCTRGAGGRGGRGGGGMRSGACIVLGVPCRTGPGAAWPISTPHFRWPSCPARRPALTCAGRAARARKTTR